jgi:hypothetical protein
MMILKCTSFFKEHKNNIWELLELLSQICSDKLINPIKITKQQEKY